MNRKSDAHADLLIEIGCEDLPARFVKPLSEALALGMADGLRAQIITYESVRAYATPRRLAVVVARVAAMQGDRAVERKGPKLAAALKDGQPTPAGLGFAKSCGVAFSELLQEDGQLVFRSTQKGGPAIKLLPEIFEETLKSMDELVPKRMRWGSGDETFVRPVQWIVAMLGSKVVPITRFGLKAANRTFGHRFHAPKAIMLSSPAEYERKLKAARVWADFETRKAEIRKQVETRAGALGGEARITETLLEEVTSLVEWPVVIAGRIEERFLELPPEVVIATIEHNQRYFPVFGRNGKLMPAFITVSNIQSRDPKQVIAGNERVVVPRLTDAMFFWEQDRKRPLSAYLPELSRVTYHKTLGSVADKVGRIGVIGSKIADDAGGSPQIVMRAAALCKADLVSRMVYEFPELQGVMGGYYARAANESEEVARAIREHYQPAQSGAAIPVTPTGRILALADRLDTLAGIFAAGQKPTASKDPFALRRAALGVLRILSEGEMRLQLRPAIGIAVAQQPLCGKDEKKDRQLAAEIFEFLIDRLRSYALDQQVSAEAFESVLATGSDSPFDFMRRIRAVLAFQKLAESRQLSAAHKRVRNILRQAAVAFSSLEADDALFVEKEERELHAELLDLESDLRSLIADGRYTEALRRLAKLQGPVDRFFDAVMVMDDNPAVRDNRLKLLSRLDEHCRSVADISCLPG